MTNALCQGPSSLEMVMCASQVQLALPQFLRPPCSCSCRISFVLCVRRRHYKLWEALRGDYEIERRFDAINRKLGPMLENAKFLLEVRAEHKSSRAEWIIIGLIMLEVFISGAGHLAHFVWY